MFHGSSGRNSDAGMDGSLLYHMAMISKMGAESRVVLEELKVPAPSVDRVLWRFYSDFVSDVKELLDDIVPLKDNLVMAVKKPALGVDEKIRLFRRLAEETKKAFQIAMKFIDMLDIDPDDISIVDKAEELKQYY